MASRNVRVTKKYLKTELDLAQKEVSGQEVDVAIVFDSNLMSHVFIRINDVQNNKNCIAILDDQYFEIGGPIELEDLKRYLVKDNVSKIMEAFRVAYGDTVLVSLNNI